MADAFPIGAHVLDRVTGETGRVVDSGNPHAVKVVYDFSPDGKVSALLPLARAERCLVLLEAVRG